jgi:hypothetical protein
VLLAAGLATALLAAVVALLAVPVDLRFLVETEGGLRSQLRIGWLFGLVDRELAGGRHTPEGESAGGPSVQTLLRVTRSQLRTHIETLILRLWRRIEIRELRVHARFGLGDPADTGMALGAISPLLALARQVPTADVVVEPCFERAELRGEAAGAVRLVPLALFPPIVAFGCSPTALRELRALRRRAR